jgi:ubiquinone/menaquinone biosynthesis C-methylase UbiE
VVTKVPEENCAANAVQVNRWNGETGHYWIANRERHLAEHRRLTPHLFRAAGISAGERILDIGCGCGETTIEAARAAGGDGRSRGGFAIGLDLSAPMLAVAQRLAAQAGVPNVCFLRGDAQACPLRAGACDVVISSFGVMFFDDPAAAFINIARTLSPSGRMAFLCWQADLHNELLAMPLRAFRKRAQQPNPAVGELFFDPERVTRLLYAAGWTDIQIGALNEQARMGTDVAEVMNYVRGMPTVRALAASIDDTALTERVFAALADEYAEHKRDDGVWVQAAAWLVTASRA